MATVKSPRELAEDRSSQAGTIVESFKAAGAGAVRSLELNNINEGEIVTIPIDYRIFQMSIPGTTNKAIKVVSEEGKDIWIGVFTRGARPLDGGDFVRPTGTVVEAAQKYASMDEFFKEELAGKKIKYTKKTTVIAAAFDGEGTRNASVWQIDFVA